MYKQALWQKILLCLLILLVFLGAKRIDSPLSKRIVQSVGQAINVEYDYSALWRQVRQAPLVKVVLEQNNWQDFAKMAKIKLSPKGEQNKPTFVDIEGQ